MTRSGRLRGLFAPIILDGEVYALLTVIATDGVPFTTEQMSRLTALAGLAEVAVSNALAHAALADSGRHFAEMAATDALTGLPNRREFERRLGQSRTRPFAVLAIDIDGLKAVNDDLGHSAGDALLRDVSTSMSDVMRQVDVLARVGGDEFAALLEDVDRIAAAGIAERLRNAAHAPRAVGEPATVSVGGALARSGEDANAVWRAADASLYDAKRLGRDRVMVQGEHPGTAAVAV